MAESKIVVCDCGYRVRARMEARPAVEVRRHAWDAHGIAFSAEEALAFVRRVELEAENGAASGAAAVGDMARGEEIE